MPLSARRSDAFCTLLLPVTLRLGKGSVTPMVLAAHPPVMCRRCSPGFSNLAVKHDQVVFNREGFPHSGELGTCAPREGGGSLRTSAPGTDPPLALSWWLLSGRRQRPRATPGFPPWAVGERSPCHLPYLQRPPRGQEHPSQLPLPGSDAHPPSYPSVGSLISWPQTSLFLAALRTWI